MKIKYLNNLAEIIVSIDEGKNITDANIVSFTDRGLRLIGQMKRLGLDIGTLQETFAGILRVRPVVIWALCSNLSWLIISRRS